MDDNEKVYITAMQRVDELVEEVIQQCYELAEENEYEKNWIIARFKERLNKRVKAVAI